MEVTFTPLSEHTGIEVVGVDLTRPVPDDLREKLYQAYLQWSVLVVRDQNFDPHQMLAAAKLFGEPFPQHNTRFQLEDCPEIHYISNQDKYESGQRYIPGAGYHTDHSNATEPPKATLLHAKRLPSSGGDTQFVNMGLAFETLDLETRGQVDGLLAEHVYQASHSARKLMGLTAAREKQVEQSVVHPLVRTHDETGRKALYVNPIRIERLLETADERALPLLDRLLEHAVQLAHEYRHQWRVGDFVMWDNRNLLHKANGDYDMAEERYLYRLMLKGPRPS
jgi:taurine dioxygenase